MGETGLVKIDFLLISSGSTKDFSGLEEQILIILELYDFFLKFNETFGEFVERIELSLDFFFNFVEQT